MRSVAGAGHYLWADFVALQRTLEDGFGVFSAFGGDEAQPIMKTGWVKIILCDQRLPAIRKSGPK